MDVSLIEFSELPFDAPQADWIFFYSRQGVKHFFNGGNYELFPYLWACMSNGTADELAQHVTDISFVGNGLPEEVAAAYSKIVGSNEITCFVRAKNSKDSIHRLLRRESDFSIPVYDNRISAHCPEGTFDILVFTSPMNVDAWFQAREYQGEKIIAIGNTTASHLAIYTAEKIIVAPQPSEEGITKALLTVL